MPRFIINIFLLILFLGISTKTFSQNKDYTSVKKYELRNGEYDIGLKLSNGQKMDVSLSVPQIVSNKKAPLIIALHWAGQSNSYKEYSRCLAFPAFESMNAFIIAPSDNGLHWVDKQNEKKLIKLINDIIKYWPIDRNKIIITGYSNGGIGSWHYASKYTNIFAAAIPMAGYYNVTEVSVPIYAIHGEKDELFNINRVKNVITESKLKGNKIELTVIKDYSHYMACYYKDALRDVANHIKSTIFKD